MNQQDWEHRVYEEVRKLTLARREEGVGHEIDTLQLLYSKAQQLERLQADVERLRADSERLEFVLKECLVQSEREPHMIISDREDIDKVMKGGEHGHDS